MRTAAPLPADAPRWKHDIADAIRRGGKSMKEVSLAIGMNETFVRDLLKREREPGAERLAKLQKYLGIEREQEGYSRQTLVNVARRLSEAGVLPPIEDDSETVVQAFIQICDEESQKLTDPIDPTDLLRVKRR
jgi:transcriptional regulator with XRE-family HTH domain